MAVLPDPMLATTGETPRRGAVEVKYDGCRGIVAVDGARVRARSRPGSSMVSWFPELATIGQDLAGRDVILDGEVIAPDAGGRPDFHSLQKRIGRTPRPGAQLAPVRFVAFDVLALDGRSLCDRPWQARRHVLEELGGHAGGTWSVAPCFDHDDLDAALEATAHLGLEGVVVKDRQAPYRPGRRSRAWVKLKHTTVSRLIVGGLATTARCRDALLVGDVDPDGHLVYRGCVEASTASGRRTEAAAVLRHAEVEHSPFSDAPPLSQVRWVQPLLVVEVRHLGHHPTGRLREPVLLAPVDLIDAPI